MKKLFTLSLLLVTLATVAQGRYKKADQLFEQMRYVEAARMYAGAFDKGDNSQELIQKAGDAYYFNSKMYDASVWYEKLFLEYKDQQIDSRYAFRFIHALKGSEQFEKAKVLIGYFSESDILNPIEVAQLKKENQAMMDELTEMLPSFKIYRLGINGRFSDFGPMFYKDKVIFASARDTMDAHTREYHWNEQSFLNLYASDRAAPRKTRKGVTVMTAQDSLRLKRNVASRLRLSNVQNFSRSVNTRYHEAAPSFSPDDKVMYFTRNNFMDGASDNQILYTKDSIPYKEDVVAELQEVSKAERGLKRDADGVNHLKLFRATRQLGSEKVKEGEENDSIWGNITSLPFNSLNYSVGHPAVTPDGSTLYFVSDMPGGLGATDIYKVSINQDGTFGQPENMGAPINTAGREMFPFVTEEKFYFSSDGHLGLGALDVFELLIHEDGTMTEPSNLGAPLNSAMDDFAFIIDEASQEGYFSSNRNGGEGDDDIYAFHREVVVILEPCVQSANGTVIDKLNKKPIGNAIVQLFDAERNELERVNSAPDGSFAFETILDCEVKYIARASKASYGEDIKEFETTLELGLELGLGLEVDPIIDLIYDDNGVKKFRIENLNFDLDKHFIRPDAATELDKIYGVMNEYPSIVIKIESHTDSRGSDAYNEALSDRRAKSTRDYLISRGIDARRIESAIGYGENRLLNECSSGVKCSNEKHDINRRSEFIITKM